MTEIRLLAVPYEVGTLRAGVGPSAERLLEGGAQDALRNAGAEVSLEIIEPEDGSPGRSGATEVKASFELMQLVASRVRRALDDGAFPVLLSGSCFAGLGVVSGLDEGSPGVVWFDAHADFNTPDTTIEGYFDGMGLAILTGGAWRAMAEQAGIATIPESAVLLVGARDVDPLEERRLEAAAIRQLPPSEIGDDDAVARAVEALDPPPSGLYVHLDLDVLDSEEAKVNAYSAPGGLSADQLEAQVRSLLDGRPVRALSLTAYDPEVDPDGRVPAIAMRLLGAVAKRVTQAS
jgi:arginase